MRGIGARDAGGGAYHAIIGTLEQVGIATVITVPLGLLGAIYVVEYGRGRLAATIRFFVDVMTGIPSIVAGLFVFAFWVLALGLGYSGFAAALALAILMLPTVVRSSEEMLKLVPDGLREASFALGVPRWKTVLRIVLPTALPRHRHRHHARGGPGRSARPRPVLLTALGDGVDQRQPVQRRAVVAAAVSSSRRPAAAAARPRPGLDRRPHPDPARHGAQPAGPAARQPQPTQAIGPTWPSASRASG